MDSIRITALEELYRVTTASLGRDGILNNPEERFSRILRAPITSTEVLRNFIQRSGLTFVPESNVGKDADIVAETVKMKTVRARRYSSAIVYDSKAMNGNDPKGYIKDMAELHRISAAETMNYISETAILDGSSSVLSTMDGKSIFNNAHVAGTTTYSNLTAGALTAANLISALSVLNSELNTKGMPTAAASMKFNLLVNSKKSTEADVLANSILQPGSNYNDNFKVVTARLGDVVSMRYWQYAGAGADNRWALTPADKMKNPWIMVVTQSPETNVTPEGRNGLQYSVIKFEVAVDCLVHFGNFGGGIA